MVSALTLALIGAALIVAGVPIGFLLQKVLPREHLTSESKEAVLLAGGLLATLTALVLGLLVNTANSSFDAANTAIIKGGADMIMLDRLLARYGPETNSVRTLMRQSLEAAIARIWSPKKQRVGGSQALEEGTQMLVVQKQLNDLKPQNNAQQLLLAQASQLTREMAQDRWILIEEIQNHLPVPILLVVVLWSAILFTSFSLVAPRNVTVFSALLVCALSVSMAVGLVLELNRPLDGLIKVSNAPLRKALEYMGK